MEKTTIEVTKPQLIEIFLAMVASSKANAMMMNLTKDPKAAQLLLESMELTQKLNEAIHVAGWCEAEDKNKCTFEETKKSYQPAREKILEVIAKSTKNTA